MKEWTEAVQHMIDWIENHVDQNKILENLSKDMGYSPWYCSVLFHDVTGMTLKSYVSGRRLARATEEIRDTKERILDIAIKYGYSSQEALSRSFKEQFGCTPAVYRKTQIPEGFEVREIPESYYLVFSYPAFDFLKENGDVMGAVESLAWNFDPMSMGYEWNENNCQDYQRHYPEKLGYQILRPVKRIKK